MKKILIIKTGTTLHELKSKKGDFDDWVVKGMALPYNSFNIVPVYKKAPLPDLDLINAVVVTGSHAMVTDRLDWSEYAADYIYKAAQLGLPMLGICYGHQLLAHSLGGKVGNNPNGPEYGTFKIRLNELGQKSQLFEGLAMNFPAQASHSQSVLHLPGGATVLASSEQEQNHAFVINGCQWGVQFHPEFDVEIVSAYIKAEIDSTEKQKELLAGVSSTPIAQQVLLRFANIVNDKMEQL